MRVSKFEWVNTPLPPPLDVYGERISKMDRKIDNISYCSWVFTKTLTICIIDLYFVSWIHVHAFTRKYNYI